MIGVGKIYNKTLEIGGRKIGYGQVPFIIAEIGINHNGSLDIAKEMICVAAEMGCDAVKFQKRTIDVVYSPEDLARSRENPFGPTNGDLKRGLEFGKKEYDIINSLCQKKGILWFASPWDEQSVDFLEQYDPPCYKIASPCNRDMGLLKYIKSKGKLIIVSVGMSDEKTVEELVKLLGEKNLIILHCTSTYPCPDSELHLRNIPHLIDKYPKAFIGYSGHEVGVYSSLVAAALGACVVERHFTLGREMWGSDHAASLETEGLRRLVKELKSLQSYLGEDKKRVLESEKPVAVKLRRVITLK